MKKRLIGAVLALFACLAFAESANTGRPHVAIPGFTNKTGDSSFDTPSTTATGSLDLTIRLLGSYEIVSSESAPPTAADKDLLAWCETENVDYVLYGSVSALKGDAQEYALAVFDRAKGKTTIRKTAKRSLRPRRLFVRGHPDLCRHRRYRRPPCRLRLDCLRGRASRKQRRNGNHLARRNKDY